MAFRPIGPIRLTLTQRFIAYLLLLGVLPLLAVGAISIQMSRSALRSEAHGYVTQALKDKSALLNAHMAQVEAIIANISGVEEITNVLSVESPHSDTYTRLATQARIGYVLNNYLNLQGLVSIEIFTLSGNHYHVGETLDAGNLDIAQRDRLIRETQANFRTIYWAGIRPNVNGNSKYHTVLVAARLIYRWNREASRQEPVALLAVNYDPNYIRHLFADTDSANSDYMILLDGDNHYVHHPDDTLVGKTAAPEFLTQLAAEPHTSETSGALVQSTRLWVSQWRLAVLVPEEIMNRSNRDITRASALVMLASLALVGMGGFFFFKRVVMPLREITSRFQQLRAEPGSKQQPLSVIGDDEITALGSGFNDLLNALEARNEAEKALLLSEAQLRANLDNTPNVAIQWYDDNGRLSYWNPTSEKLLGWSGTESIGKTLDQLIYTQERATQFLHGLNKIKETGLPYGPFESIIKSRDGSDHCLLSTIFSIPIGNERTGFVCMEMDITDRKKAESALRHLNLELEDRVRERTRELEASNSDLTRARDVAEEANRAKSEFLANMSHELRTPMHAILAYTKLGMEKAGADEAAKQKIVHYLSRIDQSAARLLTLLNDLLDLSKLESGKMDYHMAAVNLAEVVKSSAQELKAFAGSRQISLLVEDCASPVVWCDAARMIQVVRNLLSNAIKFSPEGRAVRLRCRPCHLNGDEHESERHDDAIRVSVVDEGIGIPENELDSVFNKFVQSSKTQTGAGGTGLGLSICREIVQAHGGRIWAENNAGEGVTFHFSVPLVVTRTAPESMLATTG